MFDTVPYATEDDGPDTLDIELHRPQPGVVLLTVAGEVDTLTAPPLDAALKRMLDGDDSVAAVDLTGVTFLASSGLAVLIQAAHRAEGSGRRIRLIVSGRPVRRPLEITGTDQLFDLHTDRDAALSAGDTRP